MTATETPSRSSETLRARLVELTRNLILIPSTADRPEEIDRCMEFVINHVEGAGTVTVHRYRRGGSPCTVLLPHGTGAPKVLLLAHLDVVSLPAGSLYRSEIRDGRIYGPGAGDMKGELAILLEVFLRIHQSYAGASLGLAVTSDEERGGNHGTRFLFEETGLRCNTAIVPDSGAINEIAVEEKGTLHVKITVQGRAGHGSRPWQADNPFDRLMSVYGKMRDHFNRLASAHDHWHPTCTCTVIQTPNRVPNRIPDSAEMILDIRFPAPFTVAQIRADLRRFLDDRMTMELLIAAAPTLVAPDPLYLEVTEAITGKPATLTREHGGSDARFIASHGISVIMTRPFVGNLHAVDEWIDIASMELLYRIYEEYLIRKLSVSVR